MRSKGFKKTELMKKTGVRKWIYKGTETTDSHVYTGNSNLIERTDEDQSKRRVNCSDP